MAWAELGCSSRGAAALGIALALIAGGCGGSKEPRTAAEMYAVHCSRCHDLDGSSAEASKIAKRPVDLRGSAVQDSLSDAALAHIMIYGQGRMMGVMGLSDAHADSIARHVRTLAPASRQGGSGRLP